MLQKQSLKLPIRGFFVKPINPDQTSSIVDNHLAKVSIVWRLFWSPLCRSNTSGSTSLSSHFLICRSIKGSRFPKQLDALIEKTHVWICVLFSLFQVSTMYRVVCGLLLLVCFIGLLDLTEPSKCDFCLFKLLIILFLCELTSCFCLSVIWINRWLYLSPQNYFYVF